VTGVHGETGVGDRGIVGDYGVDKVGEIVMPLERGGIRNDVVQHVVEIIRVVVGCHREFVTRGMIKCRYIIICVWRVCRRRVRLPIPDSHIGVECFRRRGLCVVENN
jgi:hypothetical protein